MSLLANNLYNLALTLMVDDPGFETPLPTAVDFNSFSRSRRDLLGDLIMERFGRSCHDHLRERGGGIKLLAEALERAPQSNSPKTILDFRKSSDPDAGIVFLFPGQHGLGRSFQKLSSCIDGPLSVFAFDYDGLDSDATPCKSVEQSIDHFHECLLREHPETLKNAVDNDREVVLFGLCLGSCFAHAFADRLRRDHDLNVRLVFFDGLPAERISQTGMRSLLRSTRKALRNVRSRGGLERLLVRQGRRQRHMLSKHVTPAVDCPALLIRSNSVAESWDLSAESWAPFVRECRHVDLEDVSHIDLIQRRQESRISCFLQPGSSTAA